jgi:hypothetical protein
MNQRVAMNTKIVRQTIPRVCHNRCELATQFLRRFGSKNKKNLAPDKRIRSRHSGVTRRSSGQLGPSPVRERLCVGTETSQPAGVSMRQVKSRTFYAFTVVLAATFLSAPVEAQDSRPSKHFRSDGQTANRLGYLINKDTVGIISGNPNGTYLRLAYDMAAVLDDEENGIRVLPIIGAGGGGNIRDVRFLKGIDMGITQSVLLNRYKRTNEIGPIDDKIVYIAKLNNEEMHLIVRADGHQDDRRPQRQADELQRRRLGHASVERGDSQSARHQGREGVNVGQADGIEC